MRGCDGCGWYGAWHGERSEELEGLTVAIQISHKAIVRRQRVRSAGIGSTPTILRQHHQPEQLDVDLI